MPDFQMCMESMYNCPYTEICKRHPDSGTKPDPINQTWGPFLTAHGPIGNPEHCDGWWPVKEEEPTAEEEIGQTRQSTLE